MRACVRACVRTYVRTYVRMSAACAHMEEEACELSLCDVARNLGHNHTGQTPYGKITQYEKWRQNHTIRKSGENLAAKCCMNVSKYIQSNCIENMYMTMYFLEYIVCICVCCVYILLNFIIVQL